ncbi:MAG: DUF2764 domain-containing protein, partial [Kiritimatiellae bacterium]|nr:DUF2764 domain-containing protein [Kiritimatiellia bacterium]
MASYYYLVASLPALFLDEESPITPAEFMAACDQWLDADDARDIHCLMDNHSACAKASDFAKATPDTTADRPECVKGACANQWLARETEIRNALARLRAAKVRVDAEPFLRPCRELDLYTEKAVAEAMSRPQPLERELGLDRLRWSLLDDLSRFDPFGLPAVIAYALKLKLVERWSALTVEKGRAVVEEYLTKQLTEVAA